jgi:hypothetical protein
MASARRFVLTSDGRVEEDKSTPAASRWINLGRNSGRTLAAAFPSVLQSLYDLPKYRAMRSSGHAGELRMTSDPWDMLVHIHFHLDLQVCL